MLMTAVIYANRLMVHDDGNANHLFSVTDYPIQACGGVQMGCQSIAGQTNALSPTCIPIGNLLTTFNICMFFELWWETGVSGENSTHRAMAGSQTPVPEVQGNSANPRKTTMSKN